MKEFFIGAFKNLILLIIALFCTLFFAEMMVRIFIPQQIIVFDVSIFEGDEQLGHRHRYNIRTNINIGERTVSLITDKYGHRTAGRGDLDSDYDILAIGDSFLEALHVEYDDIFTSLLEKELSEGIGKDISIINSGVRSYDVGHYKIVLEREIAKKKFDKVVVFFYIGNDVIFEKRETFPPMPRMNYSVGFPSKFTKEEIVDKIIYPINESLERRSHLYNFIKDRSKILRTRLGFSSCSLPTWLMKGNFKTESYDITADTIKEMEQICKENGTDFLVVFLPPSSQIHQEELSDCIAMFNLDEDTIDLGQINREMGNRLEERGVRYIDILDEMLLYGEEKRLYGTIDSHYNPEGHKATADIMLPILLRDIKEDMKN